MTHSPLAVAGLSLLLNLPFGYWRAGCRRLSATWFAAVHLPIILVLVARLLLGVAFRLSSLPLYVAAFCVGQFLGGRLRAPRRGPV